MRVWRASRTFGMTTGGRGAYRTRRHDNARAVYPEIRRHTARARLSPTTPSHTSNPCLHSHQTLMGANSTVQMPVRQPLNRTVATSLASAGMAMKRRIGASDPKHTTTTAKIPTRSQGARTPRTRSTALGRPGPPRPATRGPGT